MTYALLSEGGALCIVPDTHCDVPCLAFESGLEYAHAVAAAHEILRDDPTDRDYPVWCDRLRTMPERDVVACAQHATEIGSRRVGRSTIAENPVRFAVIAYARHEFTNYHDLLRYDDHQSAREAVQDEIRGTVEQWEKAPNRKCKPAR